MKAIIDVPRGISYLAISTPRPYRTIYNSDLEEAK